MIARFPKFEFMQTVEHEISSLSNADYNPRRLTPQQAEDLRASIQRFGLVDPIIINTHPDRKGIIIGGHQRVKVATEMGFDRIPCVELNLPEEKERELNLRLNKNQGEWDWEKLLEGFDMEALKDIGFEDWQFDVGSWEGEAKFDAFKDETVLMNVALSRLKPHPGHYRNHPEDQLRHLITSIEEYGIYRSLIVAKDDTILDGHAIYEAAKKLNIPAVPVIKIDIEPDSIKALKILATNNELSKMSEADDRKLTEILKEIKESGDLLGTGFDEMKLANLLLVTRHQDEIADFSEAAEWVGMPEFEAGETPLKVVISLRSDEDLDRLEELLETQVRGKNGKTHHCWWPHREDEDISSVKYE